MRDKISIERAKELHPDIKDDAVRAIDEAESSLPEWMAIRIVQGRRHKKDQDALYALGRTVKNPDGYDAKKKPLGNIVTKAQWFQTYHFYALAIDFAILIDKNRDGKYEELSWNMVKDGDADGIADWQEIVAAFANHGFEWGGQWRSFPDYPHVQKLFGLNWRQLYEKYLKKEFIEGTDFVKLKAA